MSLEYIYNQKKNRCYFSTARKEILPYLPKKLLRVLEIGCGEGATLAYLKDIGVATWTCGVDLHKDSLQKAKESGVDVALCGNVEELDCLNHMPKFDAILCLDVLEHLVDPWIVIKKISQLLTYKGVILASIPNVQNIRAIAPLICGSWDYRDCGILDSGHLRFFTRKSAIRLMESGGLSVDFVGNNIERHWLPRALNLLTIGFFSRFVTVQYIIRAHK